MHPASQEHDQQDTAKVMQAQLANIFAIQSMQDYLKYLILTTSMAEGKTYPSISQFKETTSPIISSVIPSSILSLDSPIKSNTTQYSEMKISNPSSPSRDEISSPSSEEIEPQSKEEFNFHKKSHRLWNLMVKKYETKKIKVVKQEEEEAAPDERTEEGETYRNINGIYIPILKSRAPHARRQNTCPHTEREHYARGLCASCYHRTGRDKKPWNCSHDILYALGFCQRCYNNQKRQIRKQKRQLDSQSSSKMVIDPKVEEEILLKQEC